MALGSHPAGRYALGEPTDGSNPVTNEDLVAIRNAAQKVIDSLVVGTGAGDAEDLVAELEAHRDPGGVDLSTARARWVRRLLLRLVRPSTALQRDFNTTNVLILRRLTDAVTELGRASARLEASLAASRAELADLGAMVEGIAAELTERFEALGADIETHSQEMASRAERLAAIEAELARFGDGPRRIEEQAAALDRLRSAQTTLQGTMDLLLREIRRATDELPQGSLDEARRHRDEEFYAALEDALRGDRSTIKERQRLYLPFIESGGGPVLDLGSGRAEWLELLADQGIEAQGVDISEVCVAEATSRGLIAHRADALEYLAAIPDTSLGAVTAFQLVEHLPFEQLDCLVADIFRVLRPGGVLILETPNPANVRVGAMGFWHDPTHIRPLPPALLEFLARWRGFIDTELVFPDPPVERGLQLADAGPALADVNWALFGPEDYALVARRP